MTTRDSYDRVAQEYTTRFFGGLDHKPFDRELLERFAERIRQVQRGKESPAVCDLGCGPGHVGRYLHDLGLSVMGIDLSPGMIEEARGRNPDIEFRVGDMRALQIPDQTWSGIAAFYSIIHVLRDEVTAILRELRRVLLPGGWLLLAFHLGEETVHLDDWWGKPVDLDFTFYRLDEMEAYLRDAGFTVVESLERDPYPDVEHQSRRGYILARA